MTYAAPVAITISAVPLMNEVPMYAAMATASAVSAVTHAAVSATAIIAAPSAAHRHSCTRDGRSTGHHHHGSSSRDPCSDGDTHNGSGACDVRSTNVRSAGHPRGSTGWDPCSGAGHRQPCSSSRGLRSASGGHTGIGAGDVCSTEVRGAPCHQRSVRCGLGSASGYDPWACDQHGCAALVAASITAPAARNAAPGASMVTAALATFAAGGAPAACTLHEPAAQRAASASAELVLTGSFVRSNGVGEGECWLRAIRLAPILRTA